MDLACYTLTDSVIKPGIRVAAFESIATADPGTTTVMVVSVRTIPVIDTTSKKAEAVAPLSLTFLQEVASGTKPSVKGSLLAVRPALWCLYSKESNAILVDPCGLTGYVILFIPANEPAALISTTTNGLCLGTDTKGKPKTHMQNKANLLMNALSCVPGGRLSLLAPTAEAQSQKSKSAKARTSSQRRSRKVTP